MIHFALKTKKPRAPLAFRVSYECLHANWNWEMINYSHIIALLLIIKRTNGHHISLSFVFNEWPKRPHNHKVKGKIS